jgi:hypothetical protein
MKLFCEHVRTDENFNKYGFTKSEEINSQITKEKIIGYERVDGYTLNNSGIFIRD